jgi:hypothetical protein
MTFHRTLYSFYCRPLSFICTDCNLGAAIYTRKVTEISADISVSDRGVGCCLEPEGNGVNPGGGDEGGPGPPSREQDKQSTTSRVEVNSAMEREEGSGVTKRTHHAQSEDYLMFFANVLCPCV